MKRKLHLISYIYTIGISLLSATTLWQGNVLHLSVIMFMGGCLLARIPPRKHTPRKHAPRKHIPREAHALEAYPQEAHPLQEAPPPQKHTPGSTPPKKQPREGHSPDGRFSGQYASYWNAFLFSVVLTINHQQKIQP